MAIFNYELRISRNMQKGDEKPTPKKGKQPSTFSNIISYMLFQIPNENLKSE